VLDGGTLEYLQKFLQCNKYLVFEFTPSAAVFHYLPLIPETVSTGVIFAFICMCIHYLDHFFLPSIHTPCSISGQNLFYPLVLQFCRRKNIKNNKKSMTFLSFEIKRAIQGNSLYCFHAYMYYNPNWLVSTRPLHYFLVPFL
jgi:hypothetical protein